VVALSPLLFNFSLKLIIIKDQENQESLQLERIYPLLFHENDMNLLDESVHSIKKNTQALSMNKEKTTYILCLVNKIQDKNPKA
jgi:hypothetical protein